MVITRMAIVVKFSLVHETDPRPTKLCSQVDSSFLQCYSDFYSPVTFAILLSTPSIDLTRSGVLHTQISRKGGRAKSEPRVSYSLVSVKIYFGDKNREQED